MVKYKISRRVVIVVINFIIYEDKQAIRNNYVKLIHKFMGKSDVSYKIHQFASYNNEIKNFIKNNIGHNIYILDIEVPGKSGLDLAREIRNIGDYESQLLVVTAHKELLDNTFVNRSLILDFVSKYDNCEANLLTALITAYSNVTKYKSYVFKNDGELYRIPYDNILFFETEPEDGRVKVITKNNQFKVKRTISSIITELNDPRFMKTHKSCIVNLYNIDKIDLTSFTIYFSDSNKKAILSRNYKKELQERLIKQV